MDMVLKVVGIIFALLLVASALAGWPLWIPFVITAGVLIGIILLK